MSLLGLTHPAQVFTVRLAPQAAVAVAADVLRACQINRPPVKPLPFPPEFAARGGCLWVASGGSASTGRVFLWGMVDGFLPLFWRGTTDPAKAAPADVAAYAEPRGDGASALAVAMNTWWVSDMSGPCSLAPAVGVALARLQAVLKQSGWLIEAGRVRESHRLPPECLLNSGTWTRLASGRSPSKRREGRREGK
ncbi:MAG: hypothetical protein LBD77_00385 [Bifidobacteriaceae bacterium]|jgi:hypothetical protein|nr:hypothetical protein [Bifidobacteriaceae bacterium]